MVINIGSVCFLMKIIASAILNTMSVEHQITVAYRMCIVDRWS
jgi:hypothetical protein